MTIIERIYSKSLVSVLQWGRNFAIAFHQFGNIKKLKRLSSIITCFSNFIALCTTLDFTFYYKSYLTFSNLHRISINLIVLYHLCMTNTHIFTCLILLRTERNSWWIYFQWEIRQSFVFIDASSKNLCLHILKLQNSKKKQMECIGYLKQPFVLLVKKFEL